MQRGLRCAAALLAVALGALGFMAFAAGALPAQAAPAPAPALADPAPSLYGSPNERIGVGLNPKYGDITDYDVAQLEAGWWGDWATRLAPPHPNGMEYVQLVSTRASKYPPIWSQLAERIKANPGSLWLVGNEPEARFQENHTPAEYAVIYHDVYTFIKNTDPTAQVAIGGVIQPSPLRLQWLDMVRSEYQTRYGVTMPVDVWNTHMQVLNEVSCIADPGNCWGAEIPAGLTATHGITMSLAGNANVDLFKQLIQDMRAWMASRGEGDKELIVSEYGVLLPSTYICECEDWRIGDAMVQSFMTRTFEFMLTATDAATGYAADGDRLVQRWLWYTVNDKPYDFETGEGFNGALFRWDNNIYPGSLTKFGRTFKDYVTQLKTPYVDLLPVWVQSSLPVQGTAGGLDIIVQVGNLGNTASGPVSVRLFDGDPAQGGVQIGGDQVSGATPKRGDGVSTVRFHWASPPAGSAPRTLYVQVDPLNTVTEFRENNNSASFAIRLYATARIVLPVIGSKFSFASP